jgi:hypothetical protein
MYAAREPTGAIAPRLRVLVEDEDPGEQAPTDEEKAAAAVIAESCTEARLLDLLGW